MAFSLLSSLFIAKWEEKGPKAKESLKCVLRISKIFSVWVILKLNCFRKIRKKKGLKINPISWYSISSRFVLVHFWIWKYFAFDQCDLRTELNSPSQRLPYIGWCHLNSHAHECSLSAHQTRSVVVFSPWHHCKIRFFKQINKYMGLLNKLCLLYSPKTGGKSQL